MDDDKLTSQIQAFLDEWYYRILNSPVGKAWGHQKAVTLLMDIFEMVGIKIPADEKDKLIESDDDASIINAVIAALPGDLRGKFEATSLQIQTVLHEATRILSASEEDGEDAVATIFEESGSDRGGLTQEVLKASVVYAAKEVSTLRKVHVTWRKSTDNRIDRLLRASEEAEHCQQQLLALEAQLSDLRGDTKAKGKGMLLSMAEGQNTALMHSVFSSWIGYVEKVHSETAIRKKFQDQIDLCEKKLFQYKEAQISNIRGVIMRGAMEDQDVLMHMVWKFWLDEVNTAKMDGDTAEAVKAAQAKLAAMEAGQKEKAGQFMTRMASGNEASLKNICLEAWIKFHQDYALDKELEDKIKAQEKAFKAHMDAKKDEAKAVMDRMLAGSDHGLLCMMIQNWVQFIKDEKKQKELEYALSQADAKFKSLNGRQKAGAHSMQNRVNDQINANLLLRLFTSWLTETKASRVETHYHSKYASKQRQLAGVQNLFKSFAMQLEQNLGGDDDSSSRTARSAARRSHRGKNKGMNKGNEGSVSLPDIHQKPHASPVQA